MGDSTVCVGNQHDQLTFILTNYEENTVSCPGPPLQRAECRNAREAATESHV